MVVANVLSDFTAYSFHYTKGVKSHEKLYVLEGNRQKMAAQMGRDGAIQI